MLLIGRMPWLSQVFLFLSNVVYFQLCLRLYGVISKACSVINNRDKDVVRESGKEVDLVVLLGQGLSLGQVRDLLSVSDDTFAVINALVFALQKDVSISER